MRKHMLTLALVLSIIFAPHVVQAQMTHSQGGAPCVDDAGRAISCKGGNVTRIGGSDRIETAIKLSQFRYPMGADVVYVANAGNFPDALAASAIATDGPVLLTGPDKLDERVFFELQRLGATHAYVIGGEGAISAATQDEISRSLPWVEGY